MDNLHIGDRVRLYNRSLPGIIYEGGIIFTKPEFIHVYVQFDDHNVYDRILKRGWRIIYNNEEVILGNIIRDENCKITKLFVQDSKFYRNEREIDIHKILAILIWKSTHLIEQY